MLASAEAGSHGSQGFPNPHCQRVRATQNAPRDPSSVLERRHGLAEIVESGAVVPAERLRVFPPHLEREIMRVPQNTSRHGQRSVYQCLGFFEAL